jgi:hypothetical protein
MCGANGVPYASVLAEFMRKYAGVPRTPAAKPRVDTGRKRREETAAPISRPECIPEAETASVGNTPVNLQNPERYEETGNIVSALCGAVESLREIYARLRHTGTGKVTPKHNFNIGRLSK